MARVSFRFFSRSRRLAGAFSLAALLCAGSALADNWQTRFYEDGAPARAVGVDKKRRAFNYFERQSPFKLKYSYPCVTGQIPGDKEKLNDLRTPEGIYFIEYKIAGGLDFKEYGGVAYTLNYPNPVDRLRGKTGHGIWIHSKGFELSPTKGCVAIGLKDIAEVGRYLTPGTPVVLAEELGETERGENGDLSAVRQRMRDWSGAWMSRSPKLFEFYDPEAYTRATENFDAFRLNKERLFKILSFINIYNREIHALEGPGYWVTWAEQLYSASNLSTEGIRRLYWQKDKSGDFKIVGMEWIPRDVGMRADFRKGKLVAAGPRSTMTDASGEAPRPPRVDMPEQSETVADVGAVIPVLETATVSAPIQTPPAASKSSAREEKTGFSWDLNASLAALAEKFVGLSDPLVPKKRKVESAPDEIVWGEGRKMGENPVQAGGERNSAPGASRPADTPAESGETATPPALEPESDAAKGGVAAQNPVANDDEREAVLAALDAWEKAYDSRDEAIFDLYDEKNFNKIEGAPRGQSYNSAIQTIRGDLKLPWLTALARDARLTRSGDVTRSENELLLVGPTGPRQGVQRLWWRKGEDGKYRIVASEFNLSQSGVEADYLEKVSGDISAMLEAWRDAWENARVDDYVTFYTDDASQQGKVGVKSIRRQKELLWSRLKPASVRLSGLRLALDKRGIRADMTQHYADSAGRSDKGVKTLLMRFDGEKWLIYREDWAPVDAAGRPLPVVARPTATPAKPPVQAPPVKPAPVKIAPAKPVPQAPARPAKTAPKPAATKSAASR